VTRVTTLREGNARRQLDGNAGSQERRRDDHSPPPDDASERAFFEKITAGTRV
jgi:hypothetical protein